MDELQLPPELEQLERLLASGPQPSPALRERVLRRMRGELRLERGGMEKRGTVPFLWRPATKIGTVPAWRAAAAFAATLLVAMTLWMGVLQATAIATQHVQTPPSLEEIAQQLRQLSPTLSQTESLRQAFLRQISDGWRDGTPLVNVLFIPSDHELHHP